MSISQRKKKINKTHALLTEQMKYHAITLLWCNMQTTSNGKVCTLYNTVPSHSFQSKVRSLSHPRERRWRKEFQSDNVTCVAGQRRLPVQRMGQVIAQAWYVKRQRVISHFSLWLRPKASPADLLTSYFYLLVYTLLQYIISNKYSSLVTCT